MATKEDRTLSAGMSFPKWMKSKMTDKYDLDQSAFSPTELDDSFMLYYRHPVAKTTTNANMTETKCVKASNEPAIKADFGNISPKPRPKGTDDGFKSETSQVGSTILKVANQIVAGKRVPETPKPEEECEQLLAKFDPYRRRGSRSLPASPLSSPKSKRRMNQYFTGPYLEADKSKGWILSSLLAKREISQSMGFIGEEKKEELERASSAVSVDEAAAISKQKTQVFKAKPSELREMNFWSPTSM
ncbi:uncharacterized protein LOC126734695 isoform X2 [Anthonomus grandis grandis]|uniref:uncharacterized protein LOC126734695 isoform X2 n=1 Tax=Anthonomus grandis grandis TaxID=2921223 RepID=UPI002164FB03|nr:uncharacterized protein LOC126734695 isoform X2 [Anthonomus grandis grandis]